MKIGIIGAGRVGCSIGKYLRTKDIELAGYYDVDSAAAKEAAEFTRTENFDSLKQLADQSQIIFITTPDSFIIPVWEQLKELSLRNQIICHCSGALSSDSFSGRESMSVSCCSIHPMLPFSNRFSSYEQLNTAFDHGITHFDLANNYGPEYGSAEKHFGLILKEHLSAYRDELIISSKAGYDMWKGPYGNWGSRKYLIASLDQSLKRMGLDYVDIFYHHRMDPETPLEETMGALDQIVRS